jgi:hypothetical protein
MSEIILYKDESLEQELEEISWDSEKTIKLFDGTEINIKNAVEKGETITSTFYIYNNTSFEYLIEAAYHTKEGVSVSLGKSRLEEKEKCKVLLSYTVNDAEEKLEDGEFILEGTFLI